MKFLALMFAALLFLILCAFIFSGSGVVAWFIAVACAWSFLTGK